LFLFLGHIIALIFLVFFFKVVRRHDLRRPDNDVSD